MHSQNGTAVSLASKHLWLPTSQSVVAGRSVYLCVKDPPLARSAGQRWLATSQHRPSHRRDANQPGHLRPKSSIAHCKQRATASGSALFLSVSSPTYKSILNSACTSSTKSNPPDLPCPNSFLWPISPRYLWPCSQETRRAWENKRQTGHMQPDNYCKVNVVCPVCHLGECFNSCKPRFNSKDPAPRLALPCPARFVRSNGRTPCFAESSADSLWRQFF